MKHATVIRDGYEVPLIGIPPSAMEDKCDLCGKTFKFTELALVNDKMVCKQCRARFPS